MFLCCFMWPLDLHCLKGELMQPFLVPVFTRDLLSGFSAREVSVRIFEDFASSWPWILMWVALQSYRTHTATCWSTYRQKWLWRVNWDSKPSQMFWCQIWWCNTESIWISSIAAYYCILLCSIWTYVCQCNINIWIESLLVGFLSLFHPFLPTSLPSQWSANSHDSQHAVPVASEICCSSHGVGAHHWTLGCWGIW